MTLAFSGMILAGENSGDMPQATSTEGQKATTQPASEIVGFKVKSNDGQELGEVNDLIISDYGSIEYLIISEKGLFGTAEDKLAAIPWKAANVHFHQDTLLVGYSKDKIDSAPTFADLAEFENDERQVRAYYGEDFGLETGMKPESESGITDKDKQ